MIILFGFRRMLKRMGTAFIMCPYCQTPAAQSVVRVRRWFTLFFIPVVPLGSKYVLTCTMCGRSTQVARDVAERYVTPVQADSAPTGPPLEGAAAPALTVPPAVAGPETPLPTSASEEGTAAPEAPDPTP